MAILEHDSALDDKEVNPDSERLSEVHERAMRRFDDCASPTQEVRAASLAARRFVTVPGAQWDGDIGEQFANSPKFEVNKVGRGVRKIETDYRENRIVPEFRPDGEKADEDTAETLGGLHRADSYRFKSQQARDNAAFEAISGGFGAYRLTNEWEDESDRDNDHQRVNPASIVVDADQCVFFDINARLYDKSDARFAFIRVALSRDAFEEQYEGSASEFPEGAGWKMRDWFAPDVIAVAEYYEKEDVSEALWIMTYTLSGEQKRIWASEFEPGERESMIGDGWMAKRQNRKRCRVRKYILSGAEVLEDLGYIAGEMIPIVPVYGQRYFIDGVERWKGHVQDQMDRQRLYNSNISYLVEMNSLSPREVPIFAPEQMDPVISDQWARANIDRLPFLLAGVIRHDDGTIAQMGPIGYVKPPDLPPARAALLQLANQDLLEDMEDGADEVKANVSEEAMNVAAARVDAKSGIYLDNIRQSVQREGEIYFGMAREVYAEEGRTVDTMTDEGDDGQAELKTMAGGGKVVNDFAAAKYKVIASVTEATATRKDKTVKSMLNVADIANQSGDPELGQAAIMTAVLNMDGEGIDDFHDWARQRALQIGLVKPTEEEQQAMQEAAQNQQPDPTADALAAQAEDFRASADEKKAKIVEHFASAKLKGAQAIETLASAHEKHAKAGKTRAEIIRPQNWGNSNGN